MIEPYEGGDIRFSQYGNPILSYGTSGYGYDWLCAERFKVFSNMSARALDPKKFDATSFVDLVVDSCIIPPGGF